VLASVAGLSLAGCSGGLEATATGPAPTPSGAATVGAVKSRTAASQPAATTLGRSLRLVALGDSYTIGTSVKPRERWPNQLERALDPGIDLDLVANLAVNGATSQDVMDTQLRHVSSLDPDLVSLLVGVNDVVGGVDSEAYAANLQSIFQGLLTLVPAGRIVVLTIPDYTLTPSGAEYGDPAEQAERIAALNGVLERLAAQVGVLLVDIGPVADRVAEDPSLVAADGLHPSAKQYAAWVELIAPRVRAALAGSP
jgi:acyl-CoA thioesterase I